MMGSGIAPRIIFSLMDSDGAGKLSTDEFGAAHDRIFKAMDANKDGFVTMQENTSTWRHTRAVVRSRGTENAQAKCRNAGFPDHSVTELEAHIRRPSERTRPRCYARSHYC
jgi:hypothetical protein